MLSPSERTDRARYAASVRWSRLGVQDRTQATVKARAGRLEAIQARVVAAAAARGEVLSPRDLKLRTRSAQLAEMTAMRMARRAKAKTGR